SMDRSGYARGTLAVAAGFTAPVPDLDPVEWLSMGDMMGAMDHSAMGHGGMNHSGMNHNMDHMQHMNMQGMDHSRHGGMATDHSQHRRHGNPLAIPSSTVRHASTEYGPSVDMRV